MYGEDFNQDPNDGGQAFDYEPQPQIPRVEMVDQETQCEDLKTYSVAVTQTAAVKYVSQDCQTSETKMVSREIQVKIEPICVSTGVDAEENFIENIEREVEDRIKKEQDVRAKKMKKLQLSIQPADSSGGADTGGALLRPPP